MCPKTRTVKLLQLLLALVLCLALIAPALTGCATGTAPDPAPNNGDPGPTPAPPGAQAPAFDLTGGFARPDLEELPAEIQDWVENSRPIMLGQSRIYGNYLYILVTYGEKPTGGYDVTITDLEPSGSELVVLVELTEPEEGQPVTQALTYPYDLVVTAPTNLDIRFQNVEGEWPYIPTLFGIDYLQPIVAGKGGLPGIQVFAPAPNSTVPNPFLFRGVSNVFEGTVNFRVETVDGEVILEHFATGAMGDWGYFTELVNLPEDAPDELVLRVFYYSAKDGSVQNEFEIPLNHL